MFEFARLNPSFVAVSIGQHDEPVFLGLFSDKPRKSET